MSRIGKESRIGRYGCDIIPRYRKKSSKRRNIGRNLEEKENSNSENILQQI